MNEPRGDSPFSKVYMPSGLRSKDPGIAIPEDKAQVAQDIAFEAGYATKAPGLSTVCTLPALPDGIHWTDGTLAPATLIAFIGGDLKRWTGSEWETVTGGSALGTPGVRWSFVDFLGYVYATNDTDAAVMYDPAENKAKGLGIVGPVGWTVIGYFEKGETWTGDGVIATDVVNPLELKGKGKRSLKFSPSTAGTYTATRSVDLNLTTLANGMPADDWDLFEIWIYHEEYSAIDSIELRLYKDANNYVKHSVNLSLLDYGKNRDFQATTLRIPRGRFVLVGSGSTRDQVLAGITSVEIRLSVNRATNVYFDTWQFGQSPPVVTLFRKVISTFEPGEGWSGGTPDSTYADEMTGLRLSSSGTLSRSVSLNLAKWSGEYAEYESNAADVICIYVYRAVTGNLSECTMRLKTDDLNYFETSLLSRIKNSAKSRNQISIQKSEFTSVGSPNWAAISSLELSATMSGSQFLVFDSWRMEPGQKSKNLALGAGATDEAWSGQRRQKNTSNSKYWPSQSWGISVRLWSNKTGDDAYATLTKNLDLAHWADGTETLPSDQIGIWIYVASTRNLEKVRLQFSSSAGNFYYIDMPPTKFSVGGYMYWFNKREFLTDGSPNWETITSITVTLFAAAFDSKKGTPAEIWFSDIELARKVSPTAKFLWKVQYAGDNFLSAPSEPSIWYEGGMIKFEPDGTPTPLATKGSMASILNLKENPDPRVGRILIYRWSTEKPKYFLESTAPNKASALSKGWLVGKIPDHELGAQLDEGASGEIIETGAAPVPKGAKNLVFGDEHWVWLVPGYQDRIYRSGSFAPAAFSESNVFLFDCRVVDVVPLHGMAYVLTTRGIRRITGEEVIDTNFPETAVSPWGSAKLKGGAFAYLGAGQVYLWDGAQPRPIADDIKDVLDPANVKLGESMLFAQGDSLYLLLVPQGGGNYIVYQCHLPTLAWSRRSLDIRDVATRVDPDGSGKVYVLTSDKKISLLTGVVGAGVTKLRTKDDVFGTLYPKLIERVVVLASGGGTVTVRAYLDGVQIRDKNNALVDKTFTLSSTPKRHIWDMRGHGSVPITRTTACSVSVEVEHSSNDQFYLFAIGVEGRILAR